MIPAAPQNNRRTKTKRIVCLIVAVLALLAAIRVLLEAVFLLQGYYNGFGAEPHIVLIECILWALTSVLLFESYRLVKFFIKKPNAS